MLLIAAINWHSFFFLLFALVTCGFALGVLFSSNIVRMAFYLTIALGTTSGLFILAGAHFVGAMQLMIYVGGTLVLLIFGVMLTAHEGAVLMKTRAGDWVVAVIAGGSLLALLISAAVSIPTWRSNEVTPADVVVEILGWIEFVHAERWLGDAGIDADHAHAKVGALLGGGAADAADADDDCGGVGKVDDLGAGLAPPGPVALELLRQVKVKTTGEG